MAKDQSNWLIGTLNVHTNVETAERLGRGLVKITRKRGSTVVVGILTASPVEYCHIKPFLDATPRPIMIINIPTRALWLGEVIEELEAEGIAFGQMYDLYRALEQQDDLAKYQRPEFYYVERIFDQHRNVLSRRRISDRAYRLSRHKGDDVTIALTQEYEVTADAVRTAYTDHAPLDVLLKTNPYGRISQQARDVAKKLNIAVVDEEAIHTVLSS